MKINIGANLKHFFSKNKINLPVVTDDYIEIFNFEGKGIYVTSLFKFNNDDVILKVELDNSIILEQDINAFLDYFNLTDGRNITYPLKVHKGGNICKLGFSNPVEFYSSVKIFAKSNSSSQRRDLQAYSIFIGEVEE